MKDLRFCSCCSKFKEPSEFYIDAYRKDGLQRQCKTCTFARAHARMLAKPESKKKDDRNHYLRNRERLIRAAIEREKNNKEPHRKAAAKWRKSRPCYSALVSARYRVSKLNATPGWANSFFISEIYHLAKLREKATGFKWHVDHIVPLRSKLVCGLHWEGNLQVIPAILNLVKGNYSWPDKP